MSITGFPPISSAKLKRYDLDEFLNIATAFEVLFER
jgi:hypothetical protein